MGWGEVFRWVWGLALEGSCGGVGVFEGWRGQRGLWAVGGGFVSGGTLGMRGCGIFSLGCGG